MAITCATVNAALRRMGYAERLYRNTNRAHGPYYYWIGNDALRSSIVDGVSHIGHLTVDEILADLHEKRAASSR